mgnify:CR=1 FL=1
MSLSRRIARRAAVPGGQWIQRMLAKHIDKEKPGIVLKRRIALLSALACFFSAVYTVLLMTELFRRPPAYRDPWHPSIRILSITIAALLLAAVILLLYYCNCRILYDESSFTVRNFFRIRRAYSYHDISACEKRENRILLTLPDRTLRLNHMDVGRKKFLREAKKHHDFSITVVKPKNRMDWFRGNVPQPENYSVSFLILDILMLLFYLLFWIQMPIGGEAGLFPREVVFSETQVTQDGDLRLYEAGCDAPYILENYRQSLPDADAFLQSLRSGDPYTILTDDPATDSDEWYVFAIQQDDHQWLTFRQWRAAGRIRTRNFRIVGAVPPAFFLLYTAALVVVGRNPEKFGTVIVRLVFGAGKKIGTVVT